MRLPQFIVRLTRNLIGAIEDNVFNPLLQLIGKLKTHAVENFNTVVLKRIM